jgi:hypothetical protein
MSVIGNTKRTTLLVGAGSLVALAVLALVILISAKAGGDTARAATDPSVNFSISSTGCDSSGSPSATCTVAASAMFSVAVNLNHLPSNGTYDGYDASVHYSSGLTGPALSGLHQNGAGNWTDCVFAAHNLDTPGLVFTACSIGAGAPSSTYTGSLLHMDFTCSAGSTETLTLAHGDGTTDTVAADFTPHSEAADKTLTVQCGTGPTNTFTPVVTPTPCSGPCPTATATNTPPPATPTPAGVCGDVNGNGVANSLDAFFVLQYEAGLIASVPHPENADLNHDGHIDSRDATIILQIDAGLYHCS